MAPELVPQPATTSASVAEALDPVCGMTVAVATALHMSEHEGQTIYFCAAGCRERFEQEPERYLAARPQKSSEHERG